jgi:hypothetical protein
MNTHLAPSTKRRSHITILLLCYLVLLAIAMTANAAGNQPTVYDFAIPPSNHIVNVKMISAFTTLFETSMFFGPDPDLPHASMTPLAGYAFLLEHPDSGRRVLFDLGIRKDVENLSPFIRNTFGGLNGALPGSAEKDVPDQLVEGNVTLESIDTVIWRFVAVFQSVSMANRRSTAIHTSIT